jgi:cyclopropane fatty-acyl-phospholipid synthase-like methyltransferase
VSLADAWDYQGGDPGIWQFTNALKHWRFDIAPGSRVLELGCNETDFATHLLRHVPDVQMVGIDAREAADFKGQRFIVADASESSLFANPELRPGSFDWVISLGAIEHFGLGWYGDPKKPNADTLAIANAWHWLKPGGHLYFDVPWTPERHHETHHYRCYSDQSLRERFTDSFAWRAKAWCRNEHERDEFLSVRPMEKWAPFHFVMQWGTKP